MVVVQCLLVDNFEGTKIIGKLQMDISFIDSVYYYYREAVLLVVIVQVDVTYQALVHL